MGQKYNTKRQVHAKTQICRHAQKTVWSTTQEQLDRLLDLATQPTIRKFQSAKSKMGFGGHFEYQIATRIDRAPSIAYLTTP